MVTVFRTAFAIFGLACTLVVVADEKAITIPPAADAPQPLSPQESLKRMRLPQGFRMELVANEPLVVEPSCVAFDEQGRMFVCELHGYNVEGEIDVAELNKAGELDTSVRRIRWELQGGQIADQAKLRQFGVVKMLVDTNQDGIMDQAIVWANDLPPCYGIVPARRGVIVTCAPDIIYLADHDGDGKPEIRETLFTGFHVEVLERGVNNPRWGIDNWIYVGSGGQGGSITGPHLPEPVQIGNSDFRIKADGSAIEPVTGSVGTFGMTMNDVGDRFPASGGQPANYALPMPYHYLIRNPHVATPRTTLSAVNYNRGFRISQPHPWRVRRRQDPAWIKFYGDRETDSNYFSGGCSNEFYGDTIFPEPYHGNLFYCEPSLNIIHRVILERHESGYLGHRAATESNSEFLASTDQWFRPMNLRVGPDGELYIVDMYREIIEDYSAIPRFLQQQYGLDKGRDHGRIWRLVPQGFKPRPLPKLSDDNLDELVAAAARPDSRRHRNTARRLLIERRLLAAIPLLNDALHLTNHANVKINLLYTLQGLNALNVDTHVLPLLKDEHFAVRIHAMRLAEKSENQDAIQMLVDAVDDVDSSVRLQAAMSLGETSFGSASSILPQGQRHPLLPFAVQHSDQRWMDVAILSSVRNVAGKLLEYLLVTQTSHSQSLMKLLQPLAATCGAETNHDGLSMVIARLADVSEPVRHACLKGLNDGVAVRRDRPLLSPGAQRALKQLTQSDSNETREWATQLADRFHQDGANQTIQHLDAALRTALDSSQTVEQRLTAVNQLSGAPFDRLASLASLLAPVHADQLQHAVVEALGNSADKRMGGLLLQKWSSYSPTLRRLVLDQILARQNRIGDLLDALQDGTVHVNEFSSQDRERLLRLADRSLADRTANLLKNVDSNLSVQQLAKFQAALPGDRNLEHGKLLFEKHCRVCHKVGNRGYDVGPNLGTIANKPDESVLSDILNPSERIEPDYRSYFVTTVDGKSHSGVLQSESPTAVILALADGKTETILRRDIESMQASRVSLMPADFAKVLTPPDVADVIAYLRTELQKPIAP